MQRVIHGRLCALFFVRQVSVEEDNYNYTAHTLYESETFRENKQTQYETIK